MLTVLWKNESIETLYPVGPLGLGCPVGQPALLAHVPGKLPGIAGLLWPPPGPWCGPTSRACPPGQGAGELAEPPSSAVLDPPECSLPPYLLFSPLLPSCRHNKKNACSFFRRTQLSFLEAASLWQISLYELVLRVKALRPAGWLSALLRWLLPAPR